VAEADAWGRARGERLSQVRPNICEDVTTETGLAIPHPAKALRLTSCVGVDYYTSEADAAVAAQLIEARGDTYKGGFFDGAVCGRETARDYVDPVLGALYAVTVSARS
jgi:hypothetical protein